MCDFYMKLWNTAKWRVAVILGFNDYNLVIVDVATDARNELRKDIVDK